MALDVIVKFRSFLPGGGHDRAGGQRQGKTNVRGRIEVTSSVGTQGQVLTPEDLGLNRIDDLTLTLEEPILGSNAGDTRREVAYSHSAEEFYTFTINGVDGVAAGVPDASTYNMTFDAFGDSAHDVELL